MYIHVIRVYIHVMHVYIVPIYMLCYIFCSANQSIVNYRLSASRVVSSLKQLFFNAYTHYVVVCVDCVLAVIIRVMCWHTSNI